MNRYYILRRLAVTAIFVTGATLRTSADTSENYTITNIKVVPDGNEVKILSDIVLDDLKLGRNKQVLLTPVLTDGRGNTDTLPSILVNGSAMHISYERGIRPNKGDSDRRIWQELKRDNGKAQTIEYIMTVPVQKWMWSRQASVVWTGDFYDNCGCGVPYASVPGDPFVIEMNQADKMRVSYTTPIVAPPPVQLHEGEAQVQYEVNRSELHAEPYVCRNGQLIDNRGQLMIIDDSIKVALSDKNLEIDKIRICGYASPDGPYSNNESLSTARSRSLAEYLGERYQLPEGRTEYDAVPENWSGFREIVVDDKYLQSEQRDALLALIDRPAYGPSDYDAKERELRTSPEFRKMYFDMILPDWFPSLRTTKFQITTRLKPLSDEELAKIIKKTPELMSLNQMFRVARLYPEGSDDFNEVIEIALGEYPEDPIANLNAASAAFRKGDEARAEELLKKAGDTAEANNVRGIIAMSKGDLDEAIRLFQLALPLPEAKKNLEMLGVK